MRLAKYWLRYAGVLDLGKLPFQHLVKLQKPELQTCKPQQKLSLKNDKESAVQGTCRAAGTIGGFTDGCQGHYRWFHRRMPGGNKEHQPLALYHCDIDVPFRKSPQHDKLLSFLISVVCTFADSELIPSTTQPISTWSHWENTYFVIWENTYFVI